jgi:pimeloyl-ACP methyl ester carboxylesterase
MRKVAMILLLTMAVAAVVAPSSASASPTPPTCTDATLPGGANSRICMPTQGWNGQLLVFAHGYIAPGAALDFYNTTLPDGTDLVQLAESLGFAFATTTYRQNGLAILEGEDDIRQLVAKFKETSQPLRTYITGVSEGGLVTALLAEQSPELFDSSLAACGPIGSFRAQLTYFGNFRVLFDYFFPGVLPKWTQTDITIPSMVMDAWNGTYMPAIEAALAAQPARALELMRVAQAPYDPKTPATIVNTTLDVLWYNIFATNDAVTRLGGNPFGNRSTWYFGSTDDLLLNLKVARFSASPVATSALGPYQTTGNLSIPLVTLHTIEDDVIPIWQEALYAGKVDPSGRGRFLPIPVLAYGHCNFTSTQVLGALGLMVVQP